MKSFAERMLEAEKAGNQKLYEQTAQKALDASQALINLAFNTVHPHDRPFFLAAMKLSIAPIERILGETGTEIADKIVNNCVAMVFAVDMGEMKS